MVAVNIQDGRPPVIGKVIDRNENEFQILYYKGGYLKPWAPWKIGNKPWTDWLPYACIVFLNFRLDDDNKLSKEDRIHIRKKYNDINV